MLATVRAAETRVLNPGVPTSHLTEVFAIHDCVLQIDGCIRTDVVQSVVAKPTPVTMIFEDAVTAALGRLKSLRIGAVQCAKN